ncbi:MAG TPA: tetratricopeptide repeat protein [Vicinamibacteria bacterium]|nr:tetratricopeptide repeat protein [Vicinamibacteria bacterium]
MVILALVLALSPPELEESGREHLYNMDLASARKTFAELSRLAPDSPAGPYYEATALWLEELARRGGMGGATFRSGQYWSKTLREAPGEELDLRFNGLVSESVARADRLLAKDPDDAEALFFRGAVEGIASAYEAAIEHSYYRAFKTGKRARDFHDRLLELEPNNADACLLPGVFEYTIATLPRGLKVVGFLFGLRGSKEKGLELVERARRDGKRTRWAAQLSLSVIEQKEMRFGKSLALLRELEKSFPRNPFLVLERGSVHMLRKDYSAARAAFEATLARETNMELVEPAFVRLKLAESLLFAKNYEEASRQLDLAFQTPDVPAWIKAPLFLRRGMVSDALGARRAAEWDYRRARSLDTDEVTNRLADRYLAAPFR